MFKGKGWQLVLGVGAGLLVAGYSGGSLVGCASEAPANSRPAASQLKEGLTVLTAGDPTWGFNAAYVKNGRVLYIESRRGFLKPDVYRNDSPNEPAYEMDYRFVDQENHTFSAQRGGDNFADPSWAAEIMASKHLPPSAYVNRALDYETAHEAAAALSAPGALPPEFADHVYHMGRVAAMPSLANDPIMKARAEAIVHVQPTAEDIARNADAIGKSAAYGTQGYGYWNIFDTQKYSHGTVCICIFDACACAASHSAANMWDYLGYYASEPANTGSWNVIGWTDNINACNHGTCYNGSADPGMGYDCATQSGWYYNTGENGSTAGGVTGAGDGANGCQSAYSWDSSASSSHLCNDDAAYELYQSNNHPNYPNASFQIYNQGSHCDGDACGSSPSNYSCGFGGSDTGDWNTPNCGSTNF
jgi:hypothetical protein